MTRMTWLAFSIFVLAAAVLSSSGREGSCDTACRLSRVPGEPSGIFASAEKSPYHPADGTALDLPFEGK